MLAELDVVDMFAAAVFPDEDQLMLAAIERAHAGIGLGPNHEIFELCVSAPASGQHLIKMPPIRTNKVNCTIC